jgi:hypothetical protein
MYCHEFITNLLEGEAVAELDEENVLGVGVEEVAEAFPEGELAGPVKTDVGRPDYLGLRALRAGCAIPLV